jgi:hypothetical protein
MHFDLIALKITHVLLHHDPDEDASNRMLAYCKDVKLAKPVFDFSNDTVNFFSV